MDSETTTARFSYNRDKLIEIKENDYTKDLTQTNEKVFRTLRCAWRFNKKKTSQEDNKNNDIFLCPEKRSWNTGCHVENKDNTINFTRGTNANFNQQGANRPTGGGNNRYYNESTNTKSRSILGPPNTNNRNATGDFKRSAVTSGSGFTRSKGGSASSGLFMRNNAQHNKNTGKGHDSRNDHSREEEEPEWFSEGPTSITDTIELGGNIDDPFDNNSVSEAEAEQAREISSEEDVSKAKTRVEGGKANKIDACKLDSVNKEFTGSRLLRLIESQPLSSQVKNASQTDDKRKNVEDKLRSLIISAGDKKQPDSFAQSKSDDPVPMTLEELEAIQFGEAVSVDGVNNSSEDSKKPVLQDFLTSLNRGCSTNNAKRGAGASRIYSMITEVANQNAKQQVRSASMVSSSGSGSRSSIERALLESGQQSAANNGSPVHLSECKNENVSPIADSSILNIISNSAYKMNNQSLEINESSTPTSTVKIIEGLFENSPVKLPIQSSAMAAQGGSCLTSLLCKISNAQQHQQQQSVPAALAQPQIQHQSSGNSNLTELIKRQSYASAQAQQQQQMHSRMFADQRMPSGSAFHLPGDYSLMDSGANSNSANLGMSSILASLNSNIGPKSSNVVDHMPNAQNANMMFAGMPARMAGQQHQQQVPMCNPIQQQQMFDRVIAQSHMYHEKQRAKQAQQLKVTQLQQKTLAASMGMNPMNVPGQGQARAIVKGSNHAGGSNLLQQLQQSQINTQAQESFMYGSNKMNKDQIFTTCNNSSPAVPPGFGNASQPPLRRNLVSSQSTGRQMFIPNQVHQQLAAAKANGEYDSGIFNNCRLHLEQHKLDKI